MLEKKDIQNLFAVLQARYGHKWTSTYDDPDIMRIAVGEWHRELIGFRKEDLRAGLTRWAGAWPPSLPEFSRQCMPAPEALGVDLLLEVQQRLPQYQFVADNAHEEARRSKQFDEVAETVREEMTVEYLERIRICGIESLLLECQDEVPEQRRLDS